MGGGSSGRRRAVRRHGRAIKLRAAFHFEGERHFGQLRIEAGQYIGDVEDFSGAASASFTSRSVYGEKSPHSFVRTTRTFAALVSAAKYAASADVACGGAGDCGRDPLRVDTGNALSAGNDDVVRRKACGRGVEASEEQRALARAPEWRWPSWSSTSR